ncbi:Fic family protein [Ectothiorhodospira variabilis]|uniref:Fic family protein n=1 Tax=Ectothiorhodospira variabilis TaxID=505694 RepID=UPI001EFC2AF8|nr:Fic family protein [Ectothiorhodospira variabilis]MCG5493815.1 Fic family protein [Ectothiorhodospira variabilis]MCG5504014.1 Fic family protein [Ectothiorhodospira variabilis]MCG5507169.1 Fic family protein [Ectothiorhodospira variabilis]
MKIPKLKALGVLDRDLQQSLLSQIRDLWTHTSTALEGNSLTLGETKFVIEEGLTVSGKPLRDHQEVMGHARAIELIYKALGGEVTESHLFDLHRAVQSELVADIYKPCGAWKVEPNGTYAVTEEGRQTFIEYASPEDVPALMAGWLAELNRLADESLSETDAVDAYASLHLGFVHVHPFWDGNGRLARLLSNIPVLRSGHLPVVIHVRDRKEYIDILARYELASGQLTAETGVWPAEAQEAPFRAFCQRSYQATRQLVEQASEQQARRNLRRNAHKPHPDRDDE